MPQHCCCRCDARPAPACLHARLHARPTGPPRQQGLESASTARLQLTKQLVGLPTWVPTCAPSPLACQVSRKPECIMGRVQSTRLPRSGGCGVRQICAIGGAGVTLCEGSCCWACCPAQADPCASWSRQPVGMAGVPRGGATGTHTTTGRRVASAARLPPRPANIRLAASRWRPATAGAATCLGVVGDHVERGDSIP